MRTPQARRPVAELPSSKVELREQQRLRRGQTVRPPSSHTVLEEHPTNSASADDQDLFTDDSSDGVPTPLSFPYDSAPASPHGGAHIRDASTLTTQQQPVLVAAASYTETTDHHVLYSSVIPSPGNPAGHAVPNPNAGGGSHPVILTPSSSSAITPIQSPALASVPSSNPPQGWGLASQVQGNHQIPPAPASQLQQQLQQQTYPSSSAAMMPNGTPTRNNAGAASASSTPVGAAAAQSPATHALAPPPEGVFGTFEDLLNTVQRAAKDNGYGVVKLRASNYREGKATRYDLVCDRGGVKYSSTAKKRTPSTRKVDCPFRAKAVCEVQLGNKWRFVVQDGRHNHEARVPAAVPGQENTPLAQTLRSLNHKIDRMSHDMLQGFTKLDGRLDNVEKRMDALDATVSGRLGLAGLGASAPGLANGVGGPGTGGMPGDPIVVENRLSNFEARMAAMEQRMGGPMNGMEMPMDDVESRLLSSSVMQDPSAGVI